MSKYIKYMIVVLAILFICFGVHRGEETIVFQKAIKICLECIGVG